MKFGIKSITAAGFVIFSIANANALPLTRAQINQCQPHGGERNAEADLAACNAVIDSGLWRGAILKIFIFNRGTLLAGKGNFDLALKDFDKAIRLDRNFSMAYVGRGEIQRAKGNLDAAVKEFDQAIESDPNNALGYQHRAAAMELKGNFDQALKDYGSTIKLNPGNAEIYNSRCWLRATTGTNLKGALEDCNNSLRLKSDEASTLDSRGLVNTRLGLYEKAVADYSAALKLKETAGALYGRGLAKILGGDKEGGDIDIAKALKIDANVEKEYSTYGL
ncbi:tetratricopeptide repeat protein [Methylobacterium sp. D54C]